MKFIVLSACLLLSACGSPFGLFGDSKASQQQPDFCDLFQPKAIVSKLTKDEEDDALLHNKTWFCACDPKGKGSKECRKFRVGM